MDCKDIKNLIPLYIDDALDAEMSSILRAHMDSCSSCFKEYKELNTTWNLLGEIDPISPSPDYVSRFWTEISSRKSLIDKMRKIIYDFLIVTRRRRVVYAVSLLSVCFLVIFNFMNIYEKKTDDEVLASLNDDDIEMIDNIELASNYDLISQLDIIEKLDELDKGDSADI